MRFGQSPVPGAQVTTNGKLPDRAARPDLEILTFSGNQFALYLQLSSVSQDQHKVSAPPKLSLRYSS